MIPVSRRTIARASWRLALLGQGAHVEVPDLVLGGARANHLGEQGDDERQDAVEDVQLLGVVAGEDQQEPEQGLEDHRGLGDSERVPEAGRRAVLEPGDPAPHSRHQIGGDQQDADYEMDFRHGRGSLDSGSGESLAKGRNSAC